MAGIRQSKFKHVFGKPLKREDCYECIPITKGSHDSHFCAVNLKYLAVITESAGGGAFAVIPIEKTGRLTKELPLVAGHTASILDIKWSPFDDDMIASSSEDCTIKVWRIPDGGIENEQLRDPLTTLMLHQRRVNLIEWHPTAEHVLVSTGADNLTIVWNVQKQEPFCSFEVPSLVTSMSFNHNGSKLALCYKDGITRIVNARTGGILESGTCHEGKKPQQCVFLSGDRIFTTGFSKVSERQLALWDSTNLQESVWRQELDITNGVLFPFYDRDCELIYVCAKGDSTVRYFEYCPDDREVFYLSRYDSTDPQRGFAMMPKLGLKTQFNEIGRFYKLHNKNWIEVISFTVPRKSAIFQDDLYPDTSAPQPALTAEQWFSGTDAEPIKISITANQESQATSRSIPTFESRVVDTNRTSNRDSYRDSQVSGGDGDVIAQILKSVEHLEKKVRKMDCRLKQLENEASHLENDF